MKYILTPDEMRSADNFAINEFGIPSALLMENAARSSSIFIKKILKSNRNKRKKVIFFCGSGNNGGDGFALARHLYDDYEIKVYWVGDENKMSEETRTNFNSLKKIGIPIQKLETQDEIGSIDLFADAVIDALIGTGGSENIRGITLNILQKLRTFDGIKIAIDCPTGLNSLTGIANQFCFRADYTITMFSYKLGLFINDGPDFCGKILVAKLGSPTSTVLKFASTYAWETSDIKDVIPPRKRISSKFDYGRILIISGSRKYPGAACLTANSAVFAGAGLTILASTAFHPKLLPEVIQIKLKETDDGSIAAGNFEQLGEEIQKADVVAIGPGVGSNPETINMISKIIQQFSSEKPMVIDADGLRAVNSLSPLSPKTILTPHIGEFCKLFGLEKSVVERNSFFIAKEYSAKMNCIIHLKHIPSITTDGNKSFLCLAGNPGMASGGSGDVLTGIIASFLGRGLEPLVAGSLGAYVHSLCGDYLAKKYGLESTSPSLMIRVLRTVLP